MTAPNPEDAHERPQAEPNAEAVPPPDTAEVIVRVPAAKEVDAPPMGVPERDDHLFKDRDGRLGRA